MIINSKYDDVLCLCCDCGNVPLIELTQEYPIYIYITCNACNNNNKKQYLLHDYLELLLTSQTLITQQHITNNDTLTYHYCVDCDLIFTYNDTVIHSEHTITSIHSIFTSSSSSSSSKSPSTLKQTLSNTVSSFSTNITTPITTPNPNRPLFSHFTPSQQSTLNLTLSHITEINTLLHSLISTLITTYETHPLNTNAIVNLHTYSKFQPLNNTFTSYAYRPSKCISILASTRIIHLSPFHQLKPLQQPDIHLNSIYIYPSLDKIIFWSFKTRHLYISNFPSLTPITSIPVEHFVDSVTLLNDTRIVLSYSYCDEYIQIYDTSFTLETQFKVDFLGVRQIVDLENGTMLLKVDNQYNTVKQYQTVSPYKYIQSLHYHPNNNTSCIYVSKDKQYLCLGSHFGCFVIRHNKEPTYDIVRVYDKDSVDCYSTRSICEIGTQFVIGGVSAVYVINAVSLDVAVVINNDKFDSISAFGIINEHTVLAVGGGFIFELNHQTWQIENVSEHNDEYCSLLLVALPNSNKHETCCLFYKFAISSKMTAWTKRINNT